MESNNSQLLGGLKNVDKKPAAGDIKEEMIMDDFQDKGFGIDQSLHLEFSQSQMTKMREGIKKLFQLIKKGKSCQLYVDILENNKVDITEFKA